MSALWNGAPIEFFQPKRGIRQGDTLSLYLFVVCMERLVHIIDSPFVRRKWRPVLVCRGGPQISNLMLADDLVLFAEATEEQAKLSRNVLSVSVAFRVKR